MPIRPWWYQDKPPSTRPYIRGTKPPPIPRDRPDFSVNYNLPWYVWIRWNLIRPLSRFLRSLFVGLVKLVVVLLLASFPLLLGFHWLESEGDPSPKTLVLLTYWDYKYALECWKSPKTIPAFVTSNNIVVTERFFRFITDASTRLAVEGQFQADTPGEYITRACIYLKNR